MRRLKFDTDDIGTVRFHVQEIWGASRIYAACPAGAAFTSSFCACLHARWQMGLLLEALLIQCASGTPPVEGGDCSHRKAGSLCSRQQTKVYKGLLTLQGW